MPTSFHSFSVLALFWDAPLIMQIERTSISFSTHQRDMSNPFYLLFSTYAVSYIIASSLFFLVDLKVVSPTSLPQLQPLLPQPAPSILLTHTNLSQNQIRSKHINKHFSAQECCRDRNQRCLIWPTHKLVGTCITNEDFVSKSIGVATQFPKGILNVYSVTFTRSSCFFGP